MKFLLYSLSLISIMLLPAAVCPNAETLAKKDNQNNPPEELTKKQDSDKCLKNVEAIELFDQIQTFKEVHLTSEDPDFTIFMALEVIAGGDEERLMDIKQDLRNFAVTIIANDFLNPAEAFLETLIDSNKKAYYTSLFIPAPSYLPAAAPGWAKLEALIDTFEKKKEIKTFIEDIFGRKFKVLAESPEQIKYETLMTNIYIAQILRSDKNRLMALIAQFCEPHSQEKNIQYYRVAFKHVLDFFNKRFAAFKEEKKQVGELIKARKAQEAINQRLEEGKKLREEEEKRLEQERIKNFEEVQARKKRITEDRALREQQEKKKLEEFQKQEEELRKIEQQQLEEKQRKKEEEARLKREEEEKLSKEELRKRREEEARKREEDREKERQATEQAEYERWFNTNYKKLIDWHEVIHRETDWDQPRFPFKVNAFGPLMEVKVGDEASVGRIKGEILFFLDSFNIKPELRPTEEKYRQRIGGLFTADDLLYPLLSPTIPGVVLFEAVNSFAERLGHNPKDISSEDKNLVTLTLRLGDPNNDREKDKIIAEQARDFRFGVPGQVYGTNYYEVTLKIAVIFDPKNGDISIHPSFTYFEDRAVRGPGPVTEVLLKTKQPKDFIRKPEKK